MSGTTMKSTATAKPRFYSRRPPVRTALAYEACLIHILESIGTSSKPALRVRLKKEIGGDFAKSDGQINAQNT